MPIIKPGIVCIHDIKYKTGIGFKVKLTIFQRLSKLWHLFQYNLAWKFATLIITVSEYSKRQMEVIYGVSRDRIVVIGNGWDHFKRIKKDDSIFLRKEFWFQKPYFFSVSSITPNKNLNWIIQVAKNHPNNNFIICGKIPKVDNSIQNLPNNVILTGYLTDEEVKSVMSRCKAFLFPSFAEGFGIPPLEALSVGCQAIISNTTCHPEIFGNSVHYIDPHNSSVSLDEILSMPVESPQTVLDKYTYERSARILVDILKSLS